MLADLVRRVRGDGALDAIEAAYLHRATREDGGALIRGRDAIRDAELAERAGDRGALMIVADLGDMVAWRDGAGGGHHWVWRSGDRILRETLIRDHTDPRDHATPLHAPLGELRPGRGQLATGDAPDLPSDWPSTALSHATRMHRIWNARALDQVGEHDWRGPGGRAGEGAQHRRWITDLLVALPDAVLLFEHAVVTDRAVALLWRLHGHHLSDGFGRAATGRRVRATGSTILTLAGGDIAAEETLIDEGAVIDQLVRPVVDYGAI